MILTWYCTLKDDSRRVFPPANAVFTAKSKGGILMNDKELRKLQREIKTDLRWGMKENRFKGKYFAWDYLAEYNTTFGEIAFCFQQKGLICTFAMPLIEYISMNRDELFRKINHELYCNSVRM